MLMKMFPPGQVYAAWNCTMSTCMQDQKNTEKALEVLNGPWGDAVQIETHKLLLKAQLLVSLYLETLSQLRSPSSY